MQAIFVILYFLVGHIKKVKRALVSVTQLVECKPIHQKVSYLIPVRVHTKVSGLNPRWGTGDN